MQLSPIVGEPPLRGRRAKYYSLQHQGLLAKAARSGRGRQTPTGNAASQISLLQLYCVLLPSAPILDEKRGNSYILRGADLTCHDWACATGCKFQPAATSQPQPGDRLAQRAGFPKN